MPPQFLSKVHMLSSVTIAERRTQRNNCLPVFNSYVSFKDNILALQNYVHTHLLQTIT